MLAWPLFLVYLGLAIAFVVSLIAPSDYVFATVSNLSYGMAGLACTPAMQTLRRRQAGVTPRGALPLLINLLGAGKAQEAVAHVYEDAVDVEIQRVMDGGAPANQIMDRGLMHLEKHEQLLVAQTRKGCIQEMLGCEAKNEFKVCLFDATKFLINLTVPGLIFLESPKAEAGRSE